MENEITAKHQRIVWIDCAKFLGFVLVILGHLIVMENLVTSLERGLIFSFHMPLFFILSFITTSLSDSFSTFKKKTRKRAYHLLIPFFITLFVHMMFVIFYEKRDASTFEFWRSYLLNRLLGLEGEGYISIASAWFFFMIFVSQTLFDIIHLAVKRDSLLFVISIILTTLGVIIGYQKVILPLYLDMVLSSFIFFFVGYKLRSFDFNKYPLERFVICLLIFAATFTFIFTDKIYNSYYEIWLRNYPFYPLCHICAIAGSMVFIYLCIFICKLKTLGKALAYPAKYNTIFIVVHAFHQFYFYKWCNFYENQVLNDFIRILIGIAISIGIIILFRLLMYSKSKITRKKLAV